MDSQINDLAELTEAVNLRNRSNRLMRYGGLLGAAIYNFFQAALQKRAENLCVIQLFPSNKLCILGFGAPLSVCVILKSGYT
ncbi:MULTISPECIES: hypothetical protein [unclassified Carboxylicivirga]|uniref:hypothetical protein n=1 Tax=Carboxylicivirga TaxID=1628153 RepID=UPI003D334629